MTAPAPFNATHYIREQTLDELWLEASRLGAIRIWQHKPGDPYEVKIEWQRRSGSKIEAVGAKSAEIGIAISNAIIEARELGAGEH